MTGRARPLRDAGTLRQIVGAAHAVESFCQDTTLDEFRIDIKTWSATQYQILVIGEAAYRLSESFIAAYPEIPWRDIKDMRNVLAHAYDLVNLDIVWQTATRDIPALRAAIEAILPLASNAKDGGDHGL